MTSWRQKRVQLTSSKQIFPVDRRLSLFLRARIADDLWDGSSLSAGHKSVHIINYKHTHLGPNLQNFVKCTYENVTRELQIAS